MINFKSTLEIKGSVVQLKCCCLHLSKAENLTSCCWVKLESDRGQLQDGIALPADNRTFHLGSSNRF